jgi:hypothetical protein
MQRVKKETMFPTMRSGSEDAGASRHLQAWFLVVAVLATHVIDEAATDFLGFYNPLVLSVRARVHWFPMPTFTFSIWLAGLILLVIVLASMGRMVRNGSVGARLASWVLAALMFLNGIGHLGGSLFLKRWLPGTTSAPLLVAASFWLGLQTWKRGQVASSEQDAR